ncbi:MAG TPA: hypothetical protein VIJ12_04140 [Candidatus Baltobacteraceae bacterium]
MPQPSPPGPGSIGPAHPLADRLVAAYEHAPGAWILELGAGSGRNTAALRAARLDVFSLTDAMPAPAQTFSAALSTHALLHGTAQAIAAQLDLIADALVAGGRLYATFGSTRDARFGSGKALGGGTFAPADGDERGVAHTFFTQSELRELLERRFEIVSLAEVDVDAVAGKWAHPTQPLHHAIHWFVEANAR